MIMALKTSSITQKRWEGCNRTPGNLHIQMMFKCRVGYYILDWDVVLLAVRIHSLLIRETLE